MTTYKLRMFSLLLQPQLFDLNRTDPLGRSGLSIAIINENPEMMELLLSEGIQVRKKRKRRMGYLELPEN